MSIWRRSVDYKESIWSHPEWLNANCFRKVGPDSGKRQVTWKMVMLVLFLKEQGETDSSRTHMLTSCKTDDLSSGKYTFA